MSELTNQEKKDIKNEVKQALKEESKTSSNEGFTIKEDIPKLEKISDIFSRFELLAMEPEKKESVVIKLKADARGDKLYWIVIALSSIIATLGLLNNSVAVVIGAMLIAPLLRPINGLSYAIARGGSKSFFQSAKALFISLAIAIILSFFITRILGIYNETPEILARISPNILDFFIASFSAAVAVLSLKFEKLSESIAGVALAASLMPPLAVIGIELAFGNYMSALGAVTLFLANLGAIIFVSIIFFWLYGYTPHRSKLQKQSFQRMSFVIGGICIILVPLFFSFNTIKANASIIQSTEEILGENIGGIFYDYELSDVYNKNGKKHIDIILKVKQGVNTEGEIETLKERLKNSFSQKEIIFTLETRYIDLL